MAYRASQSTLGADSRRLDKLLPLCRRGCRLGHRQRALEAFTIGKNGRIAADRKCHLDLGAADVNADCGSRRARIGWPSVRLLDLEQLHADLLNVKRLAAAAAPLLVGIA